MTVLCDSLREPLTFTCNCKFGEEGEPPWRWGGILWPHFPPHRVAYMMNSQEAPVGGWPWGELFRSMVTSFNPKLLYPVGDSAGAHLAGNGGSG